MGNLVSRRTVDEPRRTTAAGRFAASPCRPLTGPGFVGVAQVRQVEVSAGQLGRVGEFLAGEGADACG